MNRLFIGAALALLTVPALATDVRLTVNVGDPGYYGPIDVGGFPQPRLIYPQPVIVQPAPVSVAREPVYLRVPPGHAKDWRKHCRKYGACGYPVYLVQDRWYNDVYAPRYRQESRRDEGDEKRAKEKWKNKKHGEGKGHKND